MEHIETLVLMHNHLLILLFIWYFQLSSTGDAFISFSFIACADLFPFRDVMCSVNISNVASSYIKIKYQIYQWGKHYRNIPVSLCMLFFLPSLYPKSGGMLDWVCCFGHLVSIKCACVAIVINIYGSFHSYYYYYCYYYVIKSKILCIHEVEHTHFLVNEEVKC